MTSPPLVFSHPTPPAINTLTLPLFHLSGHSTVDTGTPSPPQHPKVSPTTEAHPLSTILSLCHCHFCLNCSCTHPLHCNNCTAITAARTLSTTTTAPLSQPHALSPPQLPRHHRSRTHPHHHNRRTTITAASTLSIFTTCHHRS